MKKILIIGVLWFLLIADLTFTISTKKFVLNIKWNGILWVALDYYSIKKYRSSDAAMKILTVKKERLN